MCKAGGPGTSCELWEWGNEVDRIRGHSYQFLKNAAVQCHLGLAALELVMVIVLETIGMGLELIQAVGVDVLDTVTGLTHEFSHCDSIPLGVSDCVGKLNIHTSGAASNLAPLLQTVKLPAPIGLVLALHKVIVIRLAPVPDEVGRAEEECGCGPDFFHLGNVVGHRRGVHEQMLVKPVRRGREWLVRGDGGYRVLRESVELLGFLGVGDSGILRFSCGHGDGGL